MHPIHLEVFMTLSKKNKNGGFLIFLGFTALVYAIFFYMAVKTPLAGDDWGYALNGMKGNVFATLWQFYNDWSGRVLSELWGFLIAPRKTLWNIINPCLFAGSFAAIYQMTKKDDSHALSFCLLILVMMLNVNSDLRMETYSWIMGSTYVIPLMMSLVYFCLIIKEMYNPNQMPLWKKILGVFLCLYIGMTMENIAAVMVGGIAILIGYYWMVNKEVPVTLVIHFVCSLISFGIIRLSPGANARLLRDHQEWLSHPLMERLLGNVPALIQYSFSNNKFIMLFFSVALGGLLLFNRTRRNTLVLRVVGMIYLASVVLVSFADNIISVLHLDFLSFLTDINSPVIWVFWIGFVVLAFAIVFVMIEDEKTKWKTIFFIVLAGSSNLVMMVSPIFGARSSLYFVYFIITATLFIFGQWVDELQWPVLALAVVCLVLSGVRIKEYYFKYASVAKIQEERLSIIDYYLDHPEIKEIHIPRMPIYSVHAADIEEGDTYHFDTFKEYFGLAPDCTIIFEWKESYD